MKQANPPNLTSVLAALALVGAAVFVPRPAEGTSITEPATVFYGRVWAAGSGEPFLAYEGELRWTIRRADGAQFTVPTRLQSLNRGEFSYRLNIPHEALVAGAAVSSLSVPLGSVPETHSHLRITVDGLPAQILGPYGSTFDAAQALRAATYRLDLVIGLDALDADGNGLPDSWESRYGLNDPSTDPDGDGLNNLAEYRQRTDPKHDDRVPSLATREIRAYPGGTTVVRMRAVDADSASGSLLYTLTRGPDDGGLYLRNAVATPARPDQTLAVGATFSQQDILRGKVVFVHLGVSGAVDGTSFEVTLRDENAAHPTATGVVAIVYYRPPDAADGVTLATLSGTSARWPELPGVSAAEQPFAASYLLARESACAVADAFSEGMSQEIAVPSSGLTRWQYDGEYVPAYGHDRPHVLLGGLGHDRISGGMEDDVILGSRGDDTLRGNGGSDVFVLASPEDGNDTIQDFNVAEQDTLDISRALVGASRWLSDYVQLVSSATNSVLRINPAGTGAASSTMVLTLEGPPLTSLFDLVESGRLLSGDKALPARVTLVAAVPGASENGPETGVFALSRSGPVQSSLAVALQITGSAANGVDFRQVPSQVTFLPGERSLTIEITPYIDAITELSEVVQLSVLSGVGYELGATSTAQISIEDLLPQISIEPLEPLAVKADLTPGVFLVTRAGVIDRSVLVRLTLGGTAGSADYSGVPAYVNLLPWQTTALITVTPKSTAVLSNGVEYVQVSIRPDATYKPVNPTTARILLVEEQMTFGLWRDRYFAGATGDLATFASQDPGQTGIRNLQRYAFGLDPQLPQDSPGRPQFSLRDGHLTVSYRRPASVTDVQYVVEVSDDLVTWHAGEAYVEPFTPPEAASEVETVGYRFKSSVGDTVLAFMRVRVIYAP